MGMSTEENDLASELDCMHFVRKVRGVSLKDGRSLFQNYKYTFVMYDEGVQMEDDDGATLYVWSEIAQVHV